MAADLLKPYTETEVTKAPFQMAPLKSLGPDGMSPIFFQRFWHIVGKDVVACVLNLLNNLVMPSGLNATNIVLIPKSSKTIANRLKVFLHDIISPVQSAFVPGHLITDNILLAFELNHFLSTRTGGGQGWMVLKLDISKAYDKVEWSFLEQFGSLVPERGLHQGDPLSPYLFLLYTESFNSLLRSVEQRGWIKGVSIYRNALSISHFLFADDTLIFCRASIGSTRAVQGVLEVYRLASGHKINLSKSSIVFSRNAKEDLCTLIMAELDIRRENKLACYLGLSSRVFRSKRDLFATIRDRIWARISGWNVKLLSQTGGRC
ncbi:UNVERIFIED_CONTAM: putative mitochondrial protein [Sesamum latifolium]|uniref:Mitochondrial protein n=1 Tax=Sesamum latifolium TaxID=2727402 RepID=A0AAW2VGA9_9LAMI